MSAPSSGFMRYPAGDCVATPLLIGLTTSVFHSQQAACCRSRPVLAGIILLAFVRSGGAIEGQNSA